MSGRWWMVPIGVLALAACEEGAPHFASPAGDAGGPPVVDAGRPDVGPDAAVAPDRLSRAVGRMTVEQLARSIPVVTGGLRWMEDFGNGPVDMLQVLAPTLGAPDYLLVTEENLEPGLIIAKFLQDASHRICARWVERDRAAPPEERTLVHHEDWDSLEPADVDRTLRALMLRFHARRVPEDDDAALEPLRALFVNASSTAPPERAARDGWLAVCIAMMTDPEFILY